MCFHKIPVIGYLFCANCNAFLSIECISSIRQVGEKEIHTNHGKRTLFRYEEIKKCKHCGNEEIQVNYR